MMSFGVFICLLLVALGLPISLFSFWWDVFYIRKNHDKTTRFIYGDNHPFATGELSIGWVEVAFGYSQAFIFALSLKQFPKLPIKILKNNKKKGVSSDHVMFQVIVRNKNYLKLLESNRVMTIVTKLRLVAIALFFLTAFVIAIS